MGKTVIDDYLSGLEPSKRRELQRIRVIAKKLVPEAEETIAFRMPTLKLAGKPFLGFDAHTNHIGIYPYSSKTIEALADELHEYGVSRGAIRVPLGKPFPERLLKKLINLRLKAIRAE